MSLPKINMTRRVFQLGNGDVRYEVTTHVVDRGDLPFPELFLVDINDSDAEKTDVLARIATPFEIREIEGSIYVKTDATNLKYVSGDPFVAVSNVVELTSTPRDRTTAIRKGLTTYLTSTVTLFYTTVTAANAAYQTLLARLSQLVVDWRTFSTSFVTNPSQDYLLPQPGIGVEDRLTAAFSAMKAARLAAEKSRDALQADKDACEIENASDLALFDELTYDIAFLESAKQRVQSTAETASTALVLTAGTELTSPGTYYLTYAPNYETRSFCTNGGEPKSYESLLIRKRSKWETLRDKLAQHEIECAALSRQLKDAQLTVNAARAAENKSLSEVLIVCPTFDPETVNP